MKSNRRIIVPLNQQELFNIENDVTYQETNIEVWYLNETEFDLLHSLGIINDIDLICEEYLDYYERSTIIYKKGIESILDKFYEKLTLQDKILVKEQRLFPKIVSFLSLKKSTTKQKIAIIIMLITIFKLVIEKQTGVIFFG